jgi:hypothetical protein
MSNLRHWFFFTLGAVFALLLMVPLVIGAADIFWYLVTGNVLIHEWSPGRAALTVVWFIATFMVYIAAVKNR